MSGGSAHPDPCDLPHAFVRNPVVSFSSCQVCLSPESAAVHQRATERVASVIPERDIVERLREYGEDWRVRAGSKKIVDEAADTILALRATLESAPTEQGWHPIDTAPRDGTWFIAAGGGCDQPTPIKWNTRVGAWECDAVMLEDWDDQTEGYSRPALWMPLPATTPMGESL